jgi:hypothetical protein
VQTPTEHVFQQLHADGGSKAIHIEGIWTPQFACKENKTKQEQYSRIILLRERSKRSASQLVRACFVLTVALAENVALVLGGEEWSHGWPVEFV